MANHLALNARKIEAIDEFKFILETYILPLLQTNGDLIKKIELQDESELHGSLKDGLLTVTDNCVTLLTGSFELESKN